MTRLVCTPNRAINRGFDSLFDDIFSNFGNFPAAFSHPQTQFVPNVNIVESDDELKMQFETPGMDKADFKISVRDNLLTVSGERTFEHQDAVRAEIRHGSFSRSFTLPDTVEASEIAADYQNGILTLSLPKREEAKPKEIEVKLG